MDFMDRYTKSIKHTHSKNHVPGGISLKKTADYHTYERIKRELQPLGLSPFQYERIVRLFVEVLGL